MGHIWRPIGRIFGHFFAGITAVILTSILAACALTPMNNPAMRTHLAQIDIPPLAEAEGQIIRLALQRVFDPAGANLPPLYTLGVTYDTRVSIPFDEASVVQSAQATLTLTFDLRSLDGQSLWSGTRTRQGLFARSALPSIALEEERALWSDLARLIAQDIGPTLGRVLADESTHAMAERSQPSAE